MIPEFPEFAPIEITHKSLIEAIVGQYEPYSDFNFVSLFCWNTDGSTEISRLNDNLVIRMPDYITGKPCYSLLGTKLIDESLEQTLRFNGKLELIPAIVVNHIKNPEKFEIIEDQDQFDYIYSLAEHVSLPGKKFKNKRKKMSKFSRGYGDKISVTKINFADPAHTNRLKDTFKLWAEEKAKDDEDVILEGKAIDRLIDFSAQLNLVGFELRAGNAVLGFSIVEISEGGYAIYHFHKTLVSIDGADIYLTNHVSKYLLDNGCSLINWEQDLGIEGLRYSKMHYHPVNMLKKYHIAYAS